MATPYHHGDLRQALTAEARRVVEARGHEGLSLRGCAREVGVDVAACYRHFANKDAVLLSVAAGGFEQLGRAMAAALTAALEPAPEDPAAGLLACGRAYAEFGLAHPQLYRLMFNGPCQAAQMQAVLPPPDRERAAPDAYGVLSRCLDGLLEAGRIAPAARDGAELMAWSTLHGLTSLLIDGRGPDDPALRAARVEQACRYVLAGLRG